MTTLNESDSCWMYRVTPHRDCKNRESHSQTVTRAGCFTRSDLLQLSFWEQIIDLSGCHCVSGSGRMKAVLLTVLLSLQDIHSWSYFRWLRYTWTDSLNLKLPRNPKNYGEYVTAPKSFRSIPRVPSRSRGLEHKDDGRSKDWTFVQKRSRQAGYWFLF